ncbi:site-specific integrase [Pirellulales bacterium]|nr:site-specific integrase [Pirellulales bacterium]
MARPKKIWFRKDVGWWMVTIAGKKVRLAQGRKNKKLAEQKFHELMLVQYEQPDVGSPRVADLVEAFLAHSEKRYAPDTYRNYRFYSQKFAESCGQMLVHQLQPFHITRWIDAQPWNQTTEGNARRVSRRVMSWAKAEGLIHANPLLEMESVSGKSRERALSHDEFRTLLANSHGSFRILIWALRHTGARPSELYRLTWKQMRSDRLVLPVHKSVKKTKKSRVIYLIPAMQRLLGYLRNRSRSEYVFVNSRGRPWTSNAVQLRMNRIKKKVGLAQDVCAYLLRHTYGTMAVMNGCSSSTVAELMGHTSTEMVDRVYVHLAGEVEHLRDAAEQASPGPSTRYADETHRDGGTRSP